ncbi:MAG TPA: cystathionine beta-lyase [Alphaproteobacteria bacterium]|jgi:cystathionine beta-lyase
MANKSDGTPLKPDTLLTTLGRDSAAHHGIVNPPVYHASTITFPSVAALEAVNKTPFDAVYYGRHGTPTTFALQDAMAELDGGQGRRGIACGSGVAALDATIAAFVEAGDHLLVTDSAYDPTRKFCNDFLKKFGVETTYYDPMIGAGISALLRPNTKAVVVEAPGSLTFEVQDIPAIAEAAHKVGAAVIMDNSWATPLFYKAFDHGIDVSVYSATKYIVGHSDAMMGVVVTTPETFLKVRKTVAMFGAAPGPDDCYLALRGLRTLGVRLERHQKSALKVAEWLKARPEVAKILHPAFAECPGHDVWKRDFTGASGLFSIVLKPASKAALAAMLDGMRLFAMGYSWGGFESLIIPVNPTAIRTAVPWAAEGPLLRLHVGLEDVDDLIADLADGFKRLAAAS